MDDGWTIGIIGGSGLYAIDALEDARWETVETPWGPPSDAILFGRESAGVPPHVHAAADLRATIPMEPGARSLNLAVSVAMVAGEALRQLRSGHNG